MIKKVVVAAINFYRNYLSRMKIRTCRFYPTCSHYAAQAIEKNGCIKGGLLAFKRLVKCNPFHPGGYDPII